MVVFVVDLVFAWGRGQSSVVLAPIWLTDEEARSDRLAYAMCVYRLEHTKRDRMLSVGPVVDPSAATYRGIASAGRALNDAGTGCRRSLRRSTTSYDASGTGIPEMR